MQKAFIQPLVFVCLAIMYLFIVLATVGAQEVEPTPSPSPEATPLAHLTFSTCLVPESNVFRLSFRADYVAGEYRVVGQNTGFTLNLGYLSVGQTGGGFGESNTTYLLPHEDTWIKQWFNGTRWQRAGGIPVTSIQSHIENNLICEVGGRTPYYTPSPQINSGPSPAPNETPAIGGVSLPTPTATPVALAQVATKESLRLATKQVLGASDLGDTGGVGEVLTLFSLISGVASLAVGLKTFK